MISVGNHGISKNQHIDMLLSDGDVLFHSHNRVILVWFLINSNQKISFIHEVGEEAVSFLGKIL